MGFVVEEPLAVANLSMAVSSCQAWLFTKKNFLYRFFILIGKVMGTIIDGKAVAREIQAQVKEEVEGLKRRWGLVPGLGVVLVGDDPGSHLYVKNKEKACKEVGIRSEEHFLPASVSEKELLSLIQKLNRKEEIYGILVQLPLPAHIRPERILEAVSPQKDIEDRKSTRLNSSHIQKSRMPSSA